MGYVRPWLDSEDEMLIRLYKTDMRVNDICKEMSRDVKTVSKHIKLLAEEGKIERRMTVAARTQFKIAKAKELLGQGKNIDEMALEMGVSRASIYSYLQGKSTSHNKGKSSFVKRERVGPFAEPTLPNGKPVHCDEIASKLCVYGYESPNKWSHGLCRYNLCTNKMRGCSYTACNKFSRVSKENPRRVSTEDTNTISQMNLH